MTDDVDHPGRWHLALPLTTAGEDVDPWQFTDARSLDSLPPLQVPVRHPGVALDFTFAAFDIPVVSQKVQTALAAVSPGDVQWIELQVREPSVAAGPYAILNALRKGRCLDESRSEFTKWKAYNRRPDRMGSYRMVTRLAIDPDRAPADVFRIEGWLVALIVSETARSALEPFSGIRFEPVS